MIIGNALRLVKEALYQEGMKGFSSYIPEKAFKIAQVSLSNGLAAQLDVNESFVQLEKAAPPPGQVFAIDIN